MSILLGTPAQISMWVLLSRRGQCHLQIKGLKTPGLIASMKRDGLTSHNTATGALKDVNEVIFANGGPDDTRVDDKEQRRIERASGDFECCASGRCEVCTPGYVWGRDG